MFTLITISNSNSNKLLDEIQEGYMYAMKDFKLNGVYHFIDVFLMNLITASDLDNPDNDIRFHGINVHRLLTDIEQDDLRMCANSLYVCSALLSLYSTSVCFIMCTGMFLMKITGSNEIK